MCNDSFRCIEGGASLIGGGASLIGGGDCNGGADMAVNVCFLWCF